MSIENIIIYVLLPTLGYCLMRVIRLEKKIVMIMMMLSNRGYKVPDKSDTDIFLRSNNL